MTLFDTTKSRVFMLSEPSASMAISGVALRCKCSTYSGRSNVSTSNVTKIKRNVSSFPAARRLPLRRQLAWQSQAAPSQTGQARHDDGNGSGNGKMAHAGCSSGRGFLRRRRTRARCRRARRQNQNAFNDQKQQHRKKKEPPDFPLQLPGFKMTLLQRLHRQIAKEFPRFVRVNHLRIIFGRGTVDGQQAVARAINAGLRPNVLVPGGIHGNPGQILIGQAQFTASDGGNLLHPARARQEHPLQHRHQHGAVAQTRPRRVRQRSAKINFALAQTLADQKSRAILEGGQRVLLADDGLAALESSLAEWQADVLITFGQRPFVFAPAQNPEAFGVFGVLNAAPAHAVELPRVRLAGRKENHHAPGRGE